MKEISIRANAKINWSLDVIGVRKDGYHLLDMVLHSVDIADEIYITKNDTISVSSDSDYLPENEKNIAWRTVKLFKDKYGINGAGVMIKKFIPLQAGMAGGSADAAAVLQGLYKLYDIDATIGEKRDLALSLGADVPFMLTGGLARINGIGEKISEFKTEHVYNLVIIKPVEGAETAKIFKNFSNDVIIKKPDNNILISALQAGSSEDISRQMINVLQKVTTKFIPAISRLCEELINQGAKGSVMTGSGSAVFGLFENHDAANKAYGNLKDKHNMVFLTKTCSRGLIL